MAIKDGKNIQIDLQIAAGDMATLALIGKKFKDDKDDYVVSVGTVPTQNMVTVLKDSETQIFFNTVTDIVAAGIAKSFTDKPDNVRGVQTPIPVEEAMKVMFEVVPKAKKIGYIWPPAEKNAEMVIKQARAFAKQKNFELVEVTINKTDEIPTAAQSLASQKVDAFFAGSDNTASAPEPIVKVANENQVPFFASDAGTSRRGAVCGVGVDNYQNGRSSGLQLAKALKGQMKAKDLPIEDDKAYLVTCNSKAAELQGVVIPDTVLKRAQQIYSEIGGLSK